MTVIVADVGGTNTRVALAQGGQLDHGSIRRFQNADHGGLDEVLARYISDQGATDLRAAAVAVAGPVMGGVGRLTNLDWAMDGATLCRVTGAAHGEVMNDLVAQGYGLGHHAPGSDMVIRASQHRPEASDSQLVIGIGTGFNAAPVHETAQGRHVVASECGHITLPVMDAAQFSYAEALRAAQGFAGVEDVLSGRGFLAIYRQISGQETASGADLARALEAGDDPAAEAAAAQFTRVLGMVVGDLALIHLPFGGIHLIGGVARAVAPRLIDPEKGRDFRDGLLSKGRFADFMERFQIHLIGDDFAALSGMAQRLFSTKIG